MSRYFSVKAVNLLNTPCRNITYLPNVVPVCYSSPSKSSTTGSLMVLRSVLSLAILHKTLSRNITYLLTYLLTVDAVCYSSPSKSSGSSMVLRTVLSLAILQHDTELIASVLPSSTVLARDNSELAWLTAFCHLLQVLYLLAHS